VPVAGRRDIVTPARFVSTAALGVGSALLVADLGRKMRFHYMLRVFRPSSPLNVGAWLLTITASAGGVATLAALTRMRRWETRGSRRRPGRSARQYVLAVVLTNTAIPVWNHGQRSLPLLFAGSAASSARRCSSSSPRTARESSAAQVRDRREGARARGAFAYEAEAAPLRTRSHRDRGHALDDGQGRRRRQPRARDFGRSSSAPPALATVSAVAVRFAVLEAGKASARDPHATFDEQRAARARRRSRRSRMRQHVAMFCIPSSTSASLEPETEATVRHGPKRRRSR
jgi:hypothetical protein